MKTLLHFVTSCLLLFLILPAVVSAQTISIATVSGGSFCAGDPVSVSFTTTGSWGHKNAFTLQLSDPSGSFSSGFKNLGSLFDTIGGALSISATMPSNPLGSSHYRVRVIGAVPYIASSDNGTDLSLGNTAFTLKEGGFGPAWGIGIKGYMDLSNVADPLSDSIFWDFGVDATPATVAGKASNGTVLTPEVMYSSGGLKTITARVINNGCTKDTTFSKYVYDCTHPIIPHSALVISRDTSLNWNNKTGPRSIWINPGVTVDINASINATLDSVFAETGATITGRNSNKTTRYYLKAGVAAGSLKLIDGGTVLWQDAVALPNLIDEECLVMQCTGLDFDYSTAPPNAAFQPDAVAPVLPTPLQLLPNPTTGNVTITGAPENITNLEVYNALGQVVLSPQLPRSSNFSIDLSGLSNGTYYVRIVSAYGVITHKVVKN